MRWAARAALLLWLGVVLAITLSPHNTRTQERGDRAVATAKRRVDVPGVASHVSQRRETDLIGNVLLFVPLGALGVFGFDRRLAVAAAGPVLSGGIELFQAVALPARTAAIADVVTNSLGHLAGFAAAALVLGARTRPARIRR
jgi:VanZ family protein